MGTIKQAALALAGAHASATISNTATTLTAPIGATGVYLQAIDGNIRYTLDGTTPVGGSTGFLLIANDPPVHISLGDNVTLKLIRDDVADVNLQYQWTRQA